MAKVIPKATKRPVLVNQGSFTGRTPKAPYQRRGTNLSPRSPSKRILFRFLFSFSWKSVVSGLGE